MDLSAFYERLNRQSNASSATQGQLAEFPLPLAKGLSTVS